MLSGICSDLRTLHFILHKIFRKALMRLRKEKSEAIIWQKKEVSPDRISKHIRAYAVVEMVQTKSNKGVH